MKPSQSRDHKEFAYFFTVEQEVGGERDERKKQAACPLSASG